MKYTVFVFVPGVAERAKIKSWADFVEGQISLHCKAQGRGDRFFGSRTSFTLFAAKGGTASEGADELQKRLRLNGFTAPFDSEDSIRSHILNMREADVLVFVSERGHPSVRSLVSLLSGAAILRGDVEHGRRPDSISEKVYSPENHGIVIPSREIVDGKIEILPAPQTAMSPR